MKLIFFYFANVNFGGNWKG